MLFFMEWEKNQNLVEWIFCHARSTHSHERTSGPQKFLFLETTGIENDEGADIGTFVELSLKKNS
jgi:hypothetical protein